MLRKSFAFLLSGVLMLNAPTMVLAETMVSVESTEEEVFSEERAAEISDGFGEVEETHVMEEETLQQWEEEEEKFQESEISDPQFSIPEDELHEDTQNNFGSMYNREDAVPIEFGEEYEGEINTSDQKNYYSFMLDEKMTIRFTGEAWMESVSYRILRKGADGYDTISWEKESIKADETGKSTLMQTKVLRKGEYYVVVYNDPDRCTGNYKIKIEQAGANVDREHAQSMELGREYTGELGEADSLDDCTENYYSFVLGQPATVRFTGEAWMESVSYRILRKGADGYDLIAWEKESVKADETGKSTLMHTKVLSKGEYYIVVYNNPDKCIGKYTVKIEQVGTNVDKEHAQPMELGKEYAGELGEEEYSGDYVKNYYSFTLDQPATVRFTGEAWMESISYWILRKSADGYDSIAWEKESVKADETGKSTLMQTKVLSEGEYYIVVHNDPENCIGKYAVKIEQVGTNIDEEHAQPMELGKEYTGELGEGEYSGDYVKNYYSFTLDQPVTARFTGEAWMESVSYRILRKDADGYEWIVWEKESVKADETGKSKITEEIELEKGLYYVEVNNDPDGAVGQYLFTLEKEEYEGIVKLDQVCPVSVRSIEISWKEVPQASGYRVYRKVPGGNWKTLANNIPGNSYTDNNAVPGQIYYYTVKAYCYGELSERYETSQAVSTEVTVPKLTGVKQKGYDSLVFNWEEVPGADFYYVYKKEPKGKWQLLGKVEENSYTDKTAAQNTAYIYTTRAAVIVDNTLYRSEFDTEGVSGKRILEIPRIKEVKAVGARNIRLSWEALEGVSQYRLYRAVPGGKWQMLSDKVKGTSYTDNNAAPGQKYCYTIKAYYGQEMTESFKTSQTIETAMTVPKLTGVKQKGYASLVFNWEEVPGADFYYVYKKEPKGKWQLLGKVKENSYTDKTAAQNTAYIYTTRAAVIVDNTLYRSEFDTEGVSGKRILEIPRIKEVKAVGARNIRLSWEALEGVSQYRLYRAVPGGKWQMLSDRVKGTSYTDNNAVPGQEYYYTIKAYYGQELTTTFKTSNKAVAQIERPELMGTKVQNGTKIRFEWEEKAGADGYYVYRKEPGSKWQLLDIIPDNTYLDGNVKKGGTYIYTVRAYVKVAGEIYRSDFDERGLTQKVE